MSHEHTEYSAPVPDLSAAQLAEPGAVTIVVPTFNESANIRQLLRRITESVPSRLPCEVVFVDDSTDDTPEVIRDAAGDCPFPVTVLHREEPVGGLGGAVVEGMRTSKLGLDRRHGRRLPASPVPGTGVGGHRGTVERRARRRLPVHQGRQPRRARGQLPGGRLPRGHLAHQVPLPPEAARHQRSDERVLRDPAQRGHRRRPQAARLQDPPRTRRPQPPARGRRGPVRLRGALRRASPSRARGRASASCATWSDCAPRRRSPAWSASG